jgi:hypothetical protein
MASFCSLHICVCRNLCVCIYIHMYMHEGTHCSQLLQHIIHLDPVDVVRRREPVLRLRVADCTEKGFRTTRKSIDTSARKRAHSLANSP